MYLTFPACSNSVTDVVFLIDGSKSVRPENFELVKKWINQIIDKLDVSDSKAHVGLVQYSSSVKQVRVCVWCGHLTALFSPILTCFHLSSAGVPPGSLQQQERPEGCCEENGLHGEGDHDRSGSSPSGR